MMPTIEEIEAMRDRLRNASNRMGSVPAERDAAAMLDQIGQCLNQEELQMDLLLYGCAFTKEGKRIDPRIVRADDTSFKVFNLPGSDDKK